MPRKSKEIISQREKKYYEEFRFLILTFVLIAAPLLILQVWSSYAK